MAAFCRRPVGRVISVFLLNSFIFFSVSFAQELRQQNTSVRALGMGNAYVALVRDADALFYNPAGLAETSGFNWTIADPKVGISGLEAYGKVQDLQESSSFASTLRELYGEKVYATAGAKTALTTPFFAAAFYDSLNTSLAINNPAVTEIDATIINDLGYALGFGYSIVPGLQMGMVFKRISRTGNVTTLGTSLIGSLDPDQIKDQVLLEGVGYSADFGANFSPGIGPVQPVISLAWRDIGGTKFKASSGSAGAPPTDPENMVLGFAAIFDVGLVSLIPAFDYSFLNRNDVQIGKKINFGVELGLPFIDVRAGFHQGYYTLGVGLNMGLIRVDAATYGVELGAYPGQIEDRRYIVQATLELGFDANLNFVGGGSSSSGSSSSGGSRNRLKQRR